VDFEEERLMPTALGVHIFAGGFTLGVERHFDVLAHLERGMLGVKSWRAHRPGVPAVISKTATWPLSQYGRVDFVFGNPPCASWSDASRTMKREGDSLSADWARDVLAVGDAVGARVVAVESVRNAYAKGAHVYRALAGEFKYSLAWFFVNAVDQGLPQVRPRVFMVFTRGGVFAPEWSPLPRRSVTETIADAPPDAPMDLTCLRYSRKHGVTPKDVEACFPIIPPGRQLRNLDPEVVRKVSPSVADYLTSSGWPFGVKSPVRCPADDVPTLVVFGNNPKFIHPTEDRLLTMRELLRLQGYPDDFVFREASVQENLTVMGKTVCPPVADWLAGEAAAYLRGDREVLERSEAAFDCCSDAPRQAPAEAPEDATEAPEGAQDDAQGPEAMSAGIPATGAALGGAEEPEWAFAPCRSDAKTTSPCSCGCGQTITKGMLRNFICYAVGPDGLMTSGWKKIFLRKCVGMAVGTEEVVRSASRGELALTKRTMPQVRTLPVTEIRSEWLELPGPTALARILVTEGAGDDDVLAATKAVFGGRTEGPHLFTRTDLARLRVKMAKKGEV
jgi:DNA (cytosine-5)-methyltransferase 1